MPQIDLSILNQRQTPAFYADVLANRPAAGFIGRIFVSTNTFEFYRDNGTGWDLIGGPGAGTITGSGATGQVTYWNGASTVTGSNNLFYDIGNSRFGVNTNAPTAPLDIHSSLASPIVHINQTSGTNNTILSFQNVGAGLWRIGSFYNGGANDFGVFDVVGAIQPVTIKKTTGQVLIGTSTVGSGKLVVASTTGDNGVQIVGASAPSLRIDNAETGPTKRVGLGIATALNNFIQGAVDRDFCIFNGSTAAASPMLFGIYDAGLTNVQEAARISAARNLLVGTSVDAGFKADINGTARIQNEITVNGTGTNTIDRITITRSGSDSQINGIGGGFMRINAPRVNIVQNLIVSNTFGSGTNLLTIRSGVDNANITALEFRSSNASTFLASFFANTGNFGINQTTDAGFRLDVNGTAIFRSTATFATTPTMNSINDAGNNFSITRANSAGFVQLSGGSGVIIRADKDIASGGTNSVQLAGNCTIIGTTLLTPNASAQLQVDSLVKGFLPPRMTTAQKNAIGGPATGLVVYDTTLNKLSLYTGATWETVTSV